ncbi:MAG TPA: alpha/beta hydrolase [Nevskiaceae bacterium]|nr:alpha/beta hydrolase [Nevskiaceae bacterium]
MQTYQYKALPEKTIHIPIPNTSLHINAVLRGDWSQPVVILVHGLRGSNMGVLPFMGAKFLSQQGFATLRVNLYDFDTDTRNLVDCTLQTHADDFDTIVRYIRRKKAPTVLAAGHSYGGLTILRSTAQLDGAVLWDPTHLQCIALSDAQEHPQSQIIKSANAAISFNGYGRLDSLPMRKERQQYQNLEDAKLTNKEYPLLFIAAGKGILLPYIKQYFAAAQEPKKLVVVKNASHSLCDTDDILFETFDQAARWLKKYS